LSVIFIDFVGCWVCVGDRLLDQPIRVVWLKLMKLMKELTRKILRIICHWVNLFSQGRPGWQGFLVLVDAHHLLELESLHLLR
jgi:hypothetical protein